MNNGKTRSSLLALVACYLIYIAWQLFQDFNNPDTTMPQWVMVVFMVLFTGIGIALIVFAWKVWQRSKAEEEEEEKKEEDMNSLK